MAATDAPGRSHSRKTCALRSAPCWRRETVFESMVSTCSFGGHHRRVDKLLVQDDFATRLPISSRRETLGDMMKWGMAHGLPSTCRV